MLHLILFDLEVISEMEMLIWLGFKPASLIYKFNIYFIFHQKSVYIFKKIRINAFWSLQMEILQQKWCTQYSIVKAFSGCYFK